MFKARLLLLAVPSVVLAYGCSVEEVGSSKKQVGSPSSEEGASAPEDEDAVVTDDLTPPGYAITGGALFQGVKLPLFGDGFDESAELPVVVDRPGVIRIYKQVLDTSLDQNTRVTFRYVDADGATQEIKAAKVIKIDSDDTKPGSVLDVELPAAVFHEALEYQIVVTNGRKQLLYTFPEDGTSFAPLHADVRSQVVRVVVVPVKYGSSASGRLPDTSAEQMNRLSEQMRAMYPVSKVDLTVRATPLVWNQEVSPDGTGWDDLLYGILQERQDDNVPDDTYYYGVFSPDTSFGRFCQQGCVAGLSLLSERVQDAAERGSIGLGFTGDGSAETFAHEIGHAHGRNHSPCGGAAGADRDYPYSKASIGVPGWDVRTSEFIDVGTGEDQTKDFMGYCNPTWVSDYTWKALFTRITSLGSELHTRALTKKVSYRALRVDPVQPARWLGRLSVHPSPDDKTVRALLANGTSVQLPERTLDHVASRVVYVPESLRGQTLRIDGVPERVTVP